MHRDEHDLTSLIRTRRALRRDILRELYMALPERRAWRRELMERLGAPREEAEIALWMLASAGHVAADQVRVAITAAGCLAFERMEVDHMEAGE